MITLSATYHQTKHLVDPVNGTYRTVLTIDSSVGPSGFVGNYNCTVENIRGTSSKSVFVGETYFLLFLLAITPSLTFLEGERWSGWIDYITPTHHAVESVLSANK